jgi:hypothetical protein
MFGLWFFTIVVAYVISLSWDERLPFSSDNITSLSWNKWLVSSSDNITSLLWNKRLVSSSDNITSLSWNEWLAPLQTFYYIIKHLNQSGNRYPSLFFLLPKPLVHLFPLPKLDPSIFYPILDHIVCLVCSFCDPTDDYWHDDPLKLAFPID